MKRGVGMDAPVSGVMNAEPPVIQPGVLIAEAERRMERDGLDALIVVEQSGEVAGVFGRRRGA